MTPRSLAERLATPGVWFFTDLMSSPEARDFAQRLESLGYSALWLPETVSRDPFAHIAFLAEHTESLVFATGIANIFHRHPGAMTQATQTLGEQTGGRFVLGLGVSHAPLVSGLRKLDYSKPLSQMRSYLAAMDASPYRGPTTADPPPRLLAALGPKMLELAAEQTDGVHPYWTTPEHTAIAREALGPDKLVCVEQKVVLSTDAGAARAAASAAVDVYAALPNYRNSWKRLGFTEDEIEHREPRFLDGVVAWGDEAAVRRRVKDHYEAGATHVCIQPLSVDGPGVLDWHALEVLAPG
ncbi:MAG TPA: TIGR03620 family F420-dependent LLM class oxidoreductase [Acidimicrobiales bacterium]|nr:TIGR03620 family F420-dependent LLM class oxidoreductase [Acidimicrobiales bacterium]